MKQPPEFFLKESLATTAALNELEARFWAENQARADAEAKENEMATRPKPPQVFAEHEMLICTRQIGLQRGGGMPASLMLIGTLARPDDPREAREPNANN